VLRLAVLRPAAADANGMPMACLADADADGMPMP